MSLVAEATAVSKEYFDPTITQITYDKNVFTAMLKGKNKLSVDGGRDITWPVRYKKLGQAKASGMRDQVVFTSNETRTQAVETWAKYDVNTMLHLDEKAYNSGVGKIVGLIGDKLDEMKEDFEQALAYDLLSATSRGTNNITPLATVVDSADAYAGIAVADASAWASQEDASQTLIKLYGSSSISYYIDASTLGTDRPTLLLTTRAYKTKIESLIEPQKRYQDDALAKIGFQNVQFHEIPVVGDPYVPSTYLYGLDMDAFELVAHSDYDRNMTDWMDMAVAGYPFSIARYMVSLLALKCNRRNTSFKMSALTG